MLNPLLETLFLQIFQDGYLGFNSEVTVSERPMTILYKWMVLPSSIHFMSLCLYVFFSHHSNKYMYVGLFSFHSTRV